MKSFSNFDDIMTCQTSQISQVRLFQIYFIQRFFIE